MDHYVVALQEQCVLYVVSHVHEFPPHELALLPRHIRRGLLSQISPTHLLHLEQTSVAKGIDTEEIWRDISYSQLPVEFQTLLSEF